MQRWRSRSDAILTGIGTVLADNPSLNVRIGDADLQPARVIVDSQWRTPVSAKLLSLPGQVLIAGLQDTQVPQELSNSGAHCVEMPPSNRGVDLKAVMQELARRGINEVQVEAGATLCGSLIEEGLVDELLIYQAPVVLGGNAVSPFMLPRLDNMDDRVHLDWVDSRIIGKDLRLRLKPVRPD